MTLQHAPRRLRGPRPGRRPGSGRPSQAPWGTVLVMTSPFVVGLLVFTLYPVLSTLYYSFTNFQLGSVRPVELVGLRNYERLFTGSETFWVGVRNTFWMVAIMVPLRVLWAMFVAWVVQSVKRGAGVYRTMFFLPAIVPVVGASLAFIVMLNPAGPVNDLLARVGITGPAWFGDPAWSKPSLVLMALWAAGDTIVIFSAAMLDVPRELYEAADLDGAGRWQRYRHVTLPFLSPVILFSVVTGVIYTFQYFTEAFVASGSASSVQGASELLGYPGQSLLFYTTDLYQQGFVYFKTGYASAMAWLMFLVILACTLVMLRLSRSLVQDATGEGGGGR